MGAKKSREEKLVLSVHSALEVYWGWTILGVRFEAGDGNANSFGEGAASEGKIGGKPPRKYTLSAEGGGDWVVWGES